MESNLVGALARVQYIGTATSHFQSEPLVKGNATSDWDYEVRQNLEGGSSGIKEWQKLELLPRLLPRKDLYVGRSRDMGMNMYRFSFDPGRLQPGMNSFNEKLMGEYVRLLGLLDVTGQEPMVTLHHFTMPLSLTGTWNGAWQHEKVLDYFANYTENIVRFLSNPDRVRKALESVVPSHVIDRLVAKGLVRYFMPLNEPLSTLGHSYLAGDFPPYRKNRPDLLVHTMRRMAKAYGIMEEQLRVLGYALPSERAPLIGNGYNWQYFDGLGSSIPHQVLNEWITRYFEKAVARSEWIGLHYYCRTLSLPGAPDQAHKEKSDHPMFKDIYPAGIVPLLQQMHARYPSKQLFVSEIGFSDSADLRRPWWLLETVRHILRAVESGIPVKGILHWSLADMFEWDLGMSQKFGLFSEAELGMPLVASDERVRSWQVWQALAECRATGNLDPITRLNNLELRARKQHAAHAVYQ